MQGTHAGISSLKQPPKTSGWVNVAEFIRSCSDRIALLALNPPQENRLMSAPSRRPEIRRRRTRKDKIVQLRKRLAAAKSDPDRERITAKLHKLAIGSPGHPLLK